MTKYTYTGPNTTIQTKPAKFNDAGDMTDPGDTRQLVTGQTYSRLPENNRQIANLIARKLLVPEAEKEQPQPDKTTDA